MFHLSASVSTKAKRTGGGRQKKLVISQIKGKKLNGFGKNAELFYWAKFSNPERDDALVRYKNIDCDDLIADFEARRYLRTFVVSQFLC